jgi:phosphoribosylformylglycinamidine synthase
MSKILKLRGARALSEFRIAKLQSALRAVHPGIHQLAAEFWHFVELERPLERAESEVLVRLLEYGTKPQEAAAARASLLVVPRVGTISPWSSKATDIARICGLAAVRRIERGTLYSLDATLDAAQRERVAALLHDRMTDSVLDGPDGAEALVPRFEPKPMDRVPLAALEEANRGSGWRSPMTRSSTCATPIARSSATRATPS